MKRFFSFATLVFSLLIASRASAAPYELRLAPVATPPRSMEITFVAPVSDQRDLYLYFSAEPVPVLPGTGQFRDSQWPAATPRVDLGKIPASGQGKKVLTAPRDGFYHVALVAQSSLGPYEVLASAPGRTLFGNTAAVDLRYRWPLTLQAIGSSARFEGSIATAGYTPSELSSIKVFLYVAPLASPFVEGADPDTNPSKRYFVSTKTAAGPGTGIDESTGNYFFNVTNLTPGENYSYAQVFEIGGIKQIKLGSFNSDKGHLTAQQAQDSFERRSYRLLAPFPGLAVLYNPDLCLELIAQNKVSPDNPLCTKDDPSGVGNFIKYILKLMIGLCAVMLVLRIMYEGYQYAVTDVPALKLGAKNQLKDAIFGLLLALSAYLLLNTINPRLVSSSIHIENLNLSIEELGVDSAPVSGGLGSLSGNIKTDLGKMAFPAGIQCPGRTGGTGDIRSVAMSFINKVTYSQPKRGAAGPNGTIYLDCSMYVNTVLGCAGITPKTAAWTGSMSAQGERITGAVEVKNENGATNAYVNGKKLNPGDLLGVRNGDKGHVWIYIGQGQMLDSQVNKYSPGKSVVQPLDTVAKKPYAKIGELNFIVRI